MSSQRPLAMMALRALADARPDVVAPSDEATREATLAIARELAAVRARKTRRRAAWAGLAVAASVVVAIGIGKRDAVFRAGDRVTTASVDDVHGAVLLVRADRGATLGAGDTIGKGDRVVASAEGTARLHLATGTAIDVSRGADMTVAEQGRSQIYDLRAGSVHAHVAKLAPGDRFVVRTSDVEVEVRGTDFLVEVAGDACEGTTSRVRVTEGTVVVRYREHESRVTAGGSWPSGCNAAPAAPPPPVAPESPAPTTSTGDAPPARTTLGAVATTTPARTAAREVVPAAPAATTASVAPPSSSDLAEQNRLYAEAMAAKRRGDAAGAVAALDRLVAVNPRGPLVESAAVERMRLYATSDRARAAEAARSYLARYPNGYARDEARALLAAP